MKLLASIIFLITLQGCFYQTVDFADIKRATQLCTDHEGIYKIRTTALGFEATYCIDGTYFDNKQMNNGE